MAAPIKRQIVDRFVTLLTALKASDGVRTVERKPHLLYKGEALPDVGVWGGPEDMVQEGEDTQGYTLEFTVAVRVTFVKKRDEAGEADEWSKKVQELIEVDSTLNQLAVWIRYQGDEYFQQGADSPEVGVFLHYLVNYRRKKGDADATY